MSRRSKSRRCRAGLGVIAIAIILAAIAAGGAAAWWYLNQPAQEVSLPAYGLTAEQFVDRVEYTRITSLSFFGLAGDIALRFSAYYNDTNLWASTVAVLMEGEDGYEVVALHHDIPHEGNFPAPDLNATLYLVFITKDGRVDALEADCVNMKIGEWRTTATHVDPSPLLPYIKIKKAWKDIIWEHLQAIWQLSSALWSLVFSAVTTIMPMVGALWILWLIGSMVRCVKEGSVEPLVNFFVTNYNIAYKIASTIVSIISKIIDLITGPLT